MIQVHVTKKLLAKLVIAESSDSSVAGDSTGNNPLNGWHGNLITIQRRNCIVMVHDATRFPLFIPCLTQPDFANLDSWFEDSFMNTLLKCGANDQKMRIATKLLAGLSIDSICDRSVLSTMTRVKGDIEQMIDYDDAQLVDLSGPKVGAWLADSPCTIKGRKGFIVPKKMMLKLLDDAFLSCSAND